MQYPRGRGEHSLFDLGEEFRPTLNTRGKLELIWNILVAHTLEGGFLSWQGVPFKDALSRSTKDLIRE